MQWVRGTAQALASESPAELPPTLRARVLASRAAGTRGILPASEPLAYDRPQRARWAMSAAAVLLVALGYAWIGTTESEAGATAGELRFSPAMPRRGDRVQVEYRAVATLGAEHRLVLRARLRTPLDQSYNGGMKVVSVASLTRDREGSFTGEFTLPPDVVFGAFVVEDEPTAHVDDNDGRLWELLVGDGRGTPAFDALDQRAHDLMGRNWEEGHATARRMVQLFPDDVRAWNWSFAFDNWLGLDDSDSVKALQRARVAEFDTKWRNVRPVDPDLIGRIFWIARGKDSTATAFWRARLLREAPTTSFAIQERFGVLLQSLWASKDTARALAGFDTLWAEASRDRLLQVAGMAFDLARQTADTATTRRWSERIISGSIDPIAQERSMAQQFATMVRFRGEGIDRLRLAIRRLDSLPETARPLGDTRKKREETVSRIRRRSMAALGRALVADGKKREGLEVLRASAQDGWDLSVLRSAREASLAAGDTVGALRFAALIAKDPRSDIASVAADRTLATRVIGASAWDAALSAAEPAFTERMLAQAPTTSVRGRARLRDLSGTSTDIATLAAGHVTVIAIWSRGCGPAVDDLPNMDRVATRLAATGVRTISVVNERTLTPGLTAFLAEKKVRMKTYLDSHGELTTAFNSWGTPAYYVLDAEGRIRFAATSDAEEVLARAEAVRLEGGGMARSR